MIPATAGTCPVCGQRWILIWWDWPAGRPVTAEYHHQSDVERERIGLPPHPHTMVYPHDLARRIRFAEVEG